jgi:dihydropteridine reductase
MVSYGMSKTATHHLIASSVCVCFLPWLPCSSFSSLSPWRSDSLPKDATVLGVLPVTIDTPMNRKYMGDADFSTWTTPEEVADKIIEWSQTAPSARPASGHLISVRTQNNASTWKDEGNPFL